MPVMTIILDGDNAFPELKKALEDGTLIHVKDEIKVAALAGGMSSGNTSVGFCLRLPDGRFVLAETSLRLFLSAADAFKARHGDPRTGQQGVGTKGGVA